MVSCSFYQFIKPLISFMHCFPSDTLIAVVYDPTVICAVAVKWKGQLFFCLSNIYMRRPYPEITVIFHENDKT